MHEREAIAAYRALVAKGYNLISGTEGWTIAEPAGVDQPRSAMVPTIAAAQAWAAGVEAVRSIIPAEPEEPPVEEPPAEEPEEPPVEEPPVEEPEEPPVEEPPVAAKAAFGVYTGNDPNAYTQFKNWMGRDAEFITAFAGKRDWADHAGSIGWIAGVLAPTGREFYWTIPLIVHGATLSAGARGSYDGNFTNAAKEVLKTRAGDSGLIQIRVGEEFNGHWNPWAAKGKEADFIATYRRLVDRFRAVSDRFVFEWCVNMGTSSGMDPASAYPGGDHVDIIGMDFYWFLQWDPHDPVEAWDYMVTRQYGLQWLEDFAALHNKPTAYSEWGVQKDGAESYIRSAAKWFADHNVAHQSYWDSDAAYKGKLSGGQYGSTGEAFRAAFGA